MTALQANPARPGIAPRPTQETTFDGVICFGGEDWWYHNRGHYDMQMMRELSAHVPILYVNSIGMRVPRPGEGAMFIKRIRRKLASLRRGMVRVNDRFAVFSAAVLPGERVGAWTRKTLGFQVRAAAKRLGIRRPLVWVACPPAADAARSLARAGLIYQRTDRFESYTGVDSSAIAAADRGLKQSADATLFCSPLLFDEESVQCRRPLLVDHGVDYDDFARAAQSPVEPPDIAHMPRPRVGFVGGIDAHTFDPALFTRVAALLPGVQFMLVGACSLPAGWCRLGNVHLLGQRPYGQVASYMAACDVLIMPWNSGAWIQACNPVKLKEYLAVGRPVVTTWFGALRGYEGLVSVGADAGSFTAAIKRAIADPGDAGRRRARVRDQTWTCKAQAVLAALRESEIVPCNAQSEPRHGGATCGACTGEAV